jgi:hypothetical protein
MDLVFNPIYKNLVFFTSFEKLTGFLKINYSDYSI